MVVATIIIAKIIIVVIWGTFWVRYITNKYIIHKCQSNLEMWNHCPNLQMWTLSPVRWLPWDEKWVPRARLGLSVLFPCTYRTKGLRLPFVKTRKFLLAIFLRVVHGSVWWGTLFTCFHTLFRLLNSKILFLFFRFFFKICIYFFGWTGS